MRMPPLLLATLLLACPPDGPGPEGPAPDGPPATPLRARVQALGLTPVQVPPPGDPEQIELGRLLFFDRELSGSRDTACSTCHFPTFGLSDGQRISLGTGGVGLGPDRTIHDDLPPEGRNSMPIFNRGGQRTMFWDMRVSGTKEEGFVTKAGDEILDDLEHVLAAQALFPLIIPNEMFGYPEVPDVFGQPNELATTEVETVREVWALVMARVTGVPEYVDRLEAAFPDVPQEDWTLALVANALAAFQLDAFTLPDAPWDRYLAGDEAALTEAEVRGALLFYGEAGCGRCHSGSLMTDERAYNAAIPQFGPGKEPGVDGNGQDFGRGGFTEELDERYQFRTAPLRNVTLSGPWMHDGAYDDLRLAVLHMLDPRSMLLSYDFSQISDHLRVPERETPEELELVLSTLDPAFGEPIELTEEQLDDLMAFLGALESPSVEGLLDLVPDSVPSGLPVDSLD